MPKEIVFSKHAIEKIMERSIDEKLVSDTIISPEKITDSKGSTQIAQRKIKDKLLRVVFKEEEKYYIVITAYLTGKERYR